ncbi:C40 family peptidase [Thermopolyspora sp. NPDC052614]|uniref:C40 family peptidase n=1 Tax=Thermopolyspora sp. NPDC052614 TaxID=3155682 RepID=UPI00342370C8
MTVSAGAVTLQSTAAHAATAGTPTTAQAGLPATVQMSGQLSGATLSGVNLGGVKLGTRKATRKLGKVARQRARANRAIAAAKAQIGTPYRYGGTGKGGFDCSGLVQYAWRKAGVKIPRVTTAQYRAIKTKVSWKNLRGGDLIFFYGKGHVGMYVGNGKMIHAPSSGKRVRIDKLNAWRRASFSGAVRPGL